jgi:hypothetical protein
VSPSHAAKDRAEPKHPAVPTLATIAEAVSGPIPGILVKRRLVLLLLCQAWMRTSNAFMTKRSLTNIDRF